jgi:hypothetical protein
LTDSVLGDLVCLCGLTVFPVGAAAGRFLVTLVGSLVTLVGLGVGFLPVPDSFVILMVISLIYFWYLSTHLFFE